MTRMLREITELEWKDILSSRVEKERWQKQVAAAIRLFNDIPTDELERWYILPDPWPKCEREQFTNKLRRAAIPLELSRRKGFQLPPEYV